jgi:saccharopine dehydrogenase-like NADP-dependent oxidoreductase
MRIMVLGGAGKMGCIAVQDLVRNDQVGEIILADIAEAQARLVANTIEDPKITLSIFDSRDADSFEKAMRGVDVCLNATVYYANLAVMETCLKTRVHYLDLGGLFHVTRKQLQLDEAFREAGVSAVLGMGTAPGITNVQARYAADPLDAVESIKIYDGSRSPGKKKGRFTYAVPTILDELTLEPVVFRNGEFITAPPLSEFEDYCFTPPLGLLPVHLSLHSEVATLPLVYRSKGIQEVFFKINYWGMDPETVEKIRVLAEYGFGGREPVQVKGQPVVPHDLMLTLLSGNVPPITDYLAPAQVEPPDWTQEMSTEVRGRQGGEEVLYRVSTLTCKSALPTGVAPSIVSVWLAQGRIPAGVHPPESVIDPLPFFDELKKREIYTKVTITRDL